MSADKNTDESHSYRIKSDLWKAIMKKAWDLSSEAKYLIKPTDIVDLLLRKHINELDLDDIKKAKDIKSPTGGTKYP